MALLQRGPNTDLLNNLTAQIRHNGRQWEEDHSVLDSSAADELFAGSLIFEQDGFELWIGSLDDALSLRALQEHGINAFLNVAVDEGARDCAGFTGSGASGGGRPQCGRQRTHARGTSISTCGNVGDLASLHLTEVRSLATFDDTWYSHALGYDVEYMGVGAEDIDGYAIQDHFADTVDFLVRCRDGRRKVFVHCMMGVNRSVACAVAFLCSNLGVGMSLWDAIDLVSKRRGFVLSNISFLQQLTLHFATDETEPVEQVGEEYGCKDLSQQRFKSVEQISLCRQQPPRDRSQTVACTPVSAC